MDLQKKVLKNYVEAKGRRLKIREMAQETGIQMTRVFRILNGHKMKLEEYEKIQSIIDEIQAKKDDLLLLVLKAKKSLSKESLEEVQILLERKLSISLLQN